MKNLFFALMLFLPGFTLSAEPIIARAIQQGVDSGNFRATTLYEFTLDNQAVFDVMGSGDIYLQFFDQPLLPQGLEIPSRNLSFKIPNQGSAHVVFKTPETFLSGIAFCISDNPLECSPAGNGPQVSGVILTD